MPYNLKKLKKLKTTTTAPVALATAKKALKIAKSVAKPMEYKYKITAAQNVNVGQSLSNMYRLTDIVAGDGPAQRVGQKITLKNLYLRFGIKIAPGLTSQANEQANVRCIIFRDMQSDTTANPTYAEVFETADNIYTSLNSTNGDRFKVLYDQIYSLSRNGILSINRKYFKNMNSNVMYSNDTTGRDTGQLYVAWFSDQATNQPIIGFHAKVRYADN